MGAPTSKNVFVGAPDQATTGAILTGPETDTIPAQISDFVYTSLLSSGYVSEDGVTITPSDSNESIKDWSGAEIRRILTEFSGELSWTHLELNAESGGTYFGDANVAVSAASSTKGKQIRMALGKADGSAKAYYFKMKDGARRVVVFVPHGVITERGEISLVNSAAVMLPVTLAALADAAGKHIYIYTDDGVFSA
ncbi:phage tail tube protein [Herbiconiux solani]|uniref:phage tail tube protein n=1 Tax=Herbiconiux solani TaxID=661329 RepID=UPI000825C9C3|nr:hypothetical protein [Herbiconiux solani]